MTPAEMEQFIRGLFSTMKSMQSVQGGHQALIESLARIAKLQCQIEESESGSAKPAPDPNRAAAEAEIRELEWLFALNEKNAQNKEG